MNIRRRVGAAEDIVQASAWRTDETPDDGSDMAEFTLDLLTDDERAEYLATKAIAEPALQRFCATGDWAELAANWITHQQAYRLAVLTCEMVPDDPGDNDPGPIVPGPGESEVQAVALAIWQLEGAALNPFLLMRSAAWPQPPEWTVDPETLIEMRGYWLEARESLTRNCRG